MGRFCSAVRLFSILAIAAVSAQAATYVVYDDAELVRRSGVVIKGTVLDSAAQLGPGGSVRTVYRISIQSVLKGPILPATVLAVNTPGGVMGNRIVMIAGAPRFDSGQQVLLFLRQTPDGGWWTTDLALGAFKADRDQRGNRLWVRSAAEVDGWDVDGSVHRERFRAADAFEQFVSDTVSGRAASVNYFVNPLQLSTQTDSLKTIANAAVTPLTYSMTSGTETDPGFRWFSFGSTGVHWVNQNTLAGAPNGGVDAIVAALGTWTNDCPSAVNYVYQGVDATAVGGLPGLFMGAAPDMKNAVMFEEDLTLSGIPNFICGIGGTVALGGVSAVTAAQPHPVSGESFWTNIEGDVVGNKGLAGCTAFLTGGDFVSAMVHEVGHTLGIRHADKNRVNDAACPMTYDCTPGTPTAPAAIMNSTIFNGLNGALQPWDQRAIQSIYPGGACLPKGDFDSNGTTDILWRSYISGTNALWMMNGTTKSSVVVLDPIGDPSWKIVGIGDFNGDGHPDILWRNYPSGNNAIWFMNGTVKTSVALIEALPDPAWRIEGVGDFNGDGKPDILWRNYTSGTNALWLMNGSVKSSIVVLDPINDAGWKIVGTGDFNGDGKTDIVWRNETSGTNAVWLMNGTVKSSVVVLDPIYDPAWKMVGTGDFNGDGKTDIVWRNYTAGTNALWLMNGTVKTSVVLLDPLGDVTWKIQGIGEFETNGTER